MTNIAELKSALGYHEAKMIECDSEGRLADGSYHWQQANEFRAAIAQAEKAGITTGDE